MGARKARMYLDKQVVDKNVYDLARERIEMIFDRFDHVCVSFSGGKDSTVCFNLTYEEAKRRDRLPLDVVFYDEEAISYQTEDYVRRVAQLPGVSLRWMCLPFTMLNACSPAHPWWWCWDPAIPEKWTREMPPEAIAEWPGFPVYPMEKRPQIHEAVGMFFDPQKHGTVGYVMGIRATESMTRLRAVTRKKEENWIVQHLGDYDKGHVWKCYPIYDWQTSDVWTAPNKFGWDYNESYDIQELIGIHGSNQRIAPPYGAEPMQMLHMWAKGHPELWDKMVDRVPGAAAAARYSRTELYAFRGRPKPKRGETWQELIRRLLEKHEASVRKEVATRIQQEIRWHYMKIEEAGWKREDHPILPTAPHPMTGMSWEWLAMIALRGDIKRRKVAGWELGEDTPERREKLWAEYRSQREEDLTARRAVFS